MSFFFANLTKISIREISKIVHLTDIETIKFTAIEFASGLE